VSVASAATGAALKILEALVQKWVEEGKDPRREARRVVGSELAQARAQAAAAKVLASKPKRRT
jgi:hypothetical protein